MHVRALEFAVRIQAANVWKARMTEPLSFWCAGAGGSGCLGEGTPPGAGE